MRADSVVGVIVAENYNDMVEILRGLIRQQTRH